MVIYNNMNLQLKKFDMSSIADDSVVVLIGKRNTGKSYLTKDLLYYHQDVPVGTVISPTEQANHFYSNIIPPIFIHDEYTPEITSNIIKTSKVKIPFSFSYTLTNAKFLSDFGSTQDIWGEVSYGDRIPYIPQNQLNTSLSYETNAFEFNFNANYNGKFSTLADGSAEIPSYFIFDISFNYNIKKNISLKSKLLNLFNNKYAVSRAPAGLRPGHPFGFYAGVEYNF